MNWRTNYHSYFLKRVLVLFILCFISCQPLITNTCHSNGDTINISSGWELILKPSDRVNDISAGHIDVPFIFTPYLLKYFNTFKGYAIVTKKIFIPKNWESKPLMIYLGKIGDADKTYFNGCLIGSEGEFPPEEFSLWNKDRIYICKPELIQYGSLNTIEVHIACQAYSRIVGKPYIRSFNDYNELSTINYFNYLKLSLPLFVNLFIGLTFLVIFILLCKNKKSRNQYITFILQLIPGFFVILEPTLPFALFDNSIIRIKIFGISWSLLVLFHLLFLHRIYNYYRKKIEYLLILITFFNVIMIINAQSIASIKFTSIMVISILTPLSLYNLSLHIQQLIKGNNFAKLFFTVGIILAITAAHDGIVYISVFTFHIVTICGYSFTSPIFQYTSLLIFVGAGLIIVNQFISMTNDIEQMNLELEKKVDERTKELKVSLENLSKAIEFGIFVYPVKNKSHFSQQLEPKIKQAIVYINNNYHDEVSREGIASMLNLHPDYFSKAFKYYTGKRLNDYINELRIKESMRLIQYSQKTILEIAMQVGFENLKTFNRAFKKFTGKNPSNYRTYK
ncbi:MAG: helix-turn-helix domain-containing protein [Spirochaetota bacterium]